MDGSVFLYFQQTREALGPLALPKLKKPPSPNGTTEDPLAAPTGEFLIGTGADCNLVIDQTGWEPRHLDFIWQPKQSTWLLRNLSTRPVFVDERRLDPGSALPLLRWESVIDAPGTRLRFERRPTTPRFFGREIVEIPLTSHGLVIGRDELNDDGRTTPRLVLDGEMRTISKNQAELCPDGSDFILRNSTGKTILNGDQNFQQRKLVIGDCIQIPNCEFYTFKFTGHSLVCLPPAGALEGINLSVDVPKGRILHSVDIRIGRGQFVGIIGGSGQGKSTLIHALCGIVPASSGRLSVDDIPLHSPQDVARFNIGYVPQDDLVHGELTVETALYFTARLRLQADRSAVRSLVDATMETLRLTEHRRKPIRILSGGQRKRVSIASELLAGPDYLFLDEPTSGLDPQTEQALMGELAGLARRKRMAVVATTHVLQNCHLMTQLAFISRGRLIFFGTPVETARFFVYGSREMIEEAASNVCDTAVDLEAQHQFTEAELLMRFSRIYDLAQDTTQPVEEQERVAIAWENRFDRYLESETDATSRADLQPAGGSPPTPARSSRWLVFAILLQRQWKLLTSAHLNYWFLILQAAVIGVLIGWVSENIVLQMFLSVIATLWFGCSNAAQQIIGELPIFRRERLAGLGIHTYLASKFVFLTLITGAQGLLLFGLVNMASLSLHADRTPDRERIEDDAKRAEAVRNHEVPRLAMPDRATRQFRMDFFDRTWDRLARTVEDKSVDDFVIEGLNPNEAGSAAQSVELNPTGLEPNTREYFLMERLAKWFRVRENVIDSLAVRRASLKPGETVADLQRRNIHVAWLPLLLNLITLRVVTLLMAAAVGVGLGLAVSSLVNTPTQAVMWVPLILIPQILFGSFVVIVPEMDDSVLRFSSLLPSFNLQREMDVALIYGRAVPRISNKTKIPAFLANPPNTNETVTWGDQQQTLYDRISEVNKSWQNLTVNRLVLGMREKSVEQVTNQGNPANTVEVFPDSVESRRDVELNGRPLLKGEHFLELTAIVPSALVLAGWVGACYLIAAGSLYRRQTGR